MSNPEQPPEVPTGSQSVGNQQQNQGIPYTLRRIQVLDAAILTGIMATFSMTWSTDAKVTAVLAERAAEEKARLELEARDPVIRQVRYELELNAVREHVRAVDGRVQRLEGERREN